jgi:hypothetical protein
MCLRVGRYNVVSLRVSLLKGPELVVSVHIFLTFHMLLHTEKYSDDRKPCLWRQMLLVNTKLSLFFFISLINRIALDYHGDAESSTTAPSNVHIYIG